MRRRAEPAPETPWASFGDALSGMLFVFILTTFWFAWKLKGAEQEANMERDQARNERDRLAGADELARRLVGTPEAPGDLTHCLEEGHPEASLVAKPQAGEARVSLYLANAVEWFDVGSARLQDPQIVGVSQIRACLEELAGRPDLAGYNVAIYLEGHTDAVPLAKGSVFSTNWELSAARAAAVLSELLPDESAVAAGLTELERREARGAVQIVSVGMADRQPAWSRLCEDDEREPDEGPLCIALERGATLRGPARLTEWKAALLRDAALFNLRDRSCTVIATPLTTAALEKKPALELLRLWANRCPFRAAESDSENLRRALQRRSLLRRVDLRLELDPILTAVGQQNAP